MRPIVNLLLLTLGIAALGTACRSTRLQSFAKIDLDPADSIRSVVVIAVDDRDFVRETFERQFVRQFEGRQIQAWASYAKLGPSDLRGDKEQVRKKLAPWNAQAVIVTRLEEQASVAVDPQTSENLWDQRSAWSDLEEAAPSFYSAGGEVRTVVRLKSSLYRLKDGALLWVGYTDTVLKETTDRLARIQSIVRQLVQQLAQDGMIP